MAGEKKCFFGMKAELHQGSVCDSNGGYCQRSTKWGLEFREWGV